MTDVMRGSFESSDEVKHAHQVGTIKQDRVDLRDVLAKDQPKNLNDIGLTPQEEDDQLDDFLMGQNEDLHNLSYSED